MIIRAPNEIYEKKKVSILRDSLSIPDIQRVVSKDRISDIYHSILQKYENKQEFYVLGVLTVVKIGNKEYLIDGQHRFSAYLQLFDEKNFDTEVVVNTIQCNTYKQMRELFNMVNNTLPAQSIPEALDVKSYKMIVKHFTDLYPMCFSYSSTGRTQRPKIHKTSFEEFVQKVLEMYPHNTLGKLTELNQTLKSKNISFFCRQKNDKDEKIREFREKAMTNGGLLFGMFLDTNDLFTILEQR